MKAYFIKVISSILILIVFTVLFSCTDNSGVSFKNVKSETLNSSDSSSLDSSDHSSELFITDSAESSSTRSDTILSEDDVLLMTIVIDGQERYICLNPIMTFKHDYDDSDAKDEKFDFAILTDIEQSITPTLVKEGDVFMNWEIAEVSSYFLCYEDGRMYPTSNISIKLKGNATVNAEVNYFYADAFNQEYLLVIPGKENFSPFPYPVYTVYTYSPFLVKTPDYKYQIETDNITEIAERYNLKYGKYQRAVTIKELGLHFFQPGGTHYYSAVIEAFSPR